jgi:hypothetical protein
MDPLSPIVAYRYATLDKGSILSKKWGDLSKLNLEYPIDLLRSLNSVWKSHKVDRLIVHLKGLDSKLSLCLRTYTPTFMSNDSAEALKSSKSFDKELTFWVNTYSVSLDDFEGLIDSPIFDVYAKGGQKRDIIDTRVIGPLWDYTENPQELSRKKAIRGLDVLSKVDFGKQRALEVQLLSIYPGEWVKPKEFGGVLFAQEWISALLAVRPILVSGDDDLAVSQLKGLLTDWEDSLPYCPEELPDEFYTDTEMGAKLMDEFEEGCESLSAIAEIMSDIADILDTN